ncbi:hypothetical protein AAC387_Pa02g3074 [Persea americana]
MEEREKVCVTGAGGYVGSWLVKFLLSKEYVVHGTAREPADGKNAHLMKLEKAADKLLLFKASLQDYDSLLAAIKGCSGVFHVAYPVPTGTVANPQTELVEPALAGTQNVLRACSEAGVKRLIAVSSIAAVFMNPNWPQDKPMDENCWTDIDYCKSRQGSLEWYSVAKTVSESDALKYSEKSEFDVITVCPPFILGPSLQPTMTSSNMIFKDILKVKIQGLLATNLYHHLHHDPMISPSRFQGVSPLSTLGRVQSTSQILDLSCVDVRDVAEALLLVYENPEASGRYICAPHPIRVRDMVAKLKTKYPNFNYPKSYAEVGRDLKFNSEKLKRLGWNCKSLEETLAETIEQYQEAGILNKD